MNVYMYMCVCVMRGGGREGGGREKRREGGRKGGREGGKEGVTCRIGKV